MKALFLKGWLLALFMPAMLFAAGQKSTLERPELALCRNGVSLKWVSAPGVKEIILERSRNGKDFEAWASLRPSTGGHNSEYLETDFHPLSGVTYYRLRQTDTDGTVLISESSAIMVLSGESKTYSCEANAQTENLIKGEEVLVLVQDASGQDIYASLRLVDGEQPKVIDPEHYLPQGLYTITACSRQKYYSAKLSIR